MQPYHVIIPARFGSGRLPGKPLLEIAGKPMIQHVVEVAAASAATSVTVATDDRRIVDCVRTTGGEAIMTRSDHASGSDRIAEACATIGLGDDEVVVNLQGDEPLMPPALIDQVAELLSRGAGAAMATLCTALASPADLLDPAIVKVVRDGADRALYFSRAPIPWVRAADTSALAEDAAIHCRRHLGIYAYTAGYIQRFAARAPCPLEQLERLEQLRCLWYGESISCDEAVEVPGPGVDNQADLEQVRAVLAGAVD